MSACKVKIADIIHLSVIYLRTLFSTQKISRRQEPHNCGIPMPIVARRESKLSMLLVNDKEHVLLDSEPNMYVLMMISLQPHKTLFKPCC